MSKRTNNLYALTNGKSISSLVSYVSPLEEYRAAFLDANQFFVCQYTFDGDNVVTRWLTRGEFWNIAEVAASGLVERGLSKGNRIIHFFADNSFYDLAFRLAAVMLGCIPVTINRQTDDNERIVYKAKITQAKCIVYARVFKNRIRNLQAELSDCQFFEAETIEKIDVKAPIEKFPSLSYEDEKIIIFTSGTTGLPRGAVLSHRSYLANRFTFEDYFKLSPSMGLDLLLVNPLHHANSSALSDLGMRRPGVVIHLVQRYKTKFWRVLSEVAEQKRDLLVTSLVARHVDFLRDLWESSQIPVEKKKIAEALRKTDILIGSAPVGPKTVAFLKDVCGRFPHIRFGSTETCLQVMAIPTILKEDERNAAFEAGYYHRFHGEKTEGYYIGREHIPFTRVKVVKAIDPQKENYMVSCRLGEPGYFVTQGANIMNGYAGDCKATEAVFRQGWYTGLRDIGFALEGQDGLLNYYWIARDSALLIRGGANYAYEQVAAALSHILVEDLKLPIDKFKLAVVGLRVDSEHDDSCCVTIELGEDGNQMKEILKKNFIDMAIKKLPKGYHPDRVRFAKIPVNFKGAVLYEQLKQEYEKDLNKSKCVNDQ